MTRAFLYRWQRPQELRVLHQANKSVTLRSCMRTLMMPRKLEEAKVALVSLLAM